MRQLIVCLTTLWLAACAAQPPSAPPPLSTEAATPAAPQFDPAHIKRIRSALPAGYEIADVSGPLSAAGLWGFGSGWTAGPAPCAALADPAPADPGARGYSASGPGGIVYVVVAVPGQGPPDAGLIGDCPHWTMTFAHTTGEVTLAPPSEVPYIEGVDTVAMTVATRTVVESGTETDGRAVTAQAYLGDHVAFVTLVTDPGSPHPPLDSRFVGDLLVATVSALRG
ncbi:DUF5642 family protein [Mycobacterium sp. shizuoka-1]|uniref:DUF5642 family protein n=1 Tax=Mycobacterium sp. shizuoka-1 TaxID=2039281 RepID=UPI000C063F30|nr:DUF5642 family protein [Mycobacterium sp. shizuoka-1]GAY14859.1 hypothetical protein MSZK_15850 [Mycobacterium sp. shizuoka-1]